MKKSLIALAVAAGSIAAAQADTTTLYGSIGFSSVVSQTQVGNKIFDDVKDTVKGIKENHWDIQTTTAKIGIKGTEDLGNSTQVFFKLESGDPGYAYLGFKGDFGTFTIGTQKSLFKEVTSTGIFNDVGIGYNFGKKAFGAGYPGTVEKAVSYVTPESAGLQLGASVVADNTNFSSLGADIWEVAAMYKVDGWNAGIVYSNVGQGHKEVQDNKVKAVKDSTQEFIGLNVGYNTDQYKIVGRAVHQSSVATEYGIEGEYKDGANTYRAGFGVFDPKMSGIKNVYNVALGYQYNFSQRTYTWVEGQYTDYNQEGISNGFKALVGVRHDF